jgi:hypothetical protein
MFFPQSLPQGHADMFVVARRNSMTCGVPGGRALRKMVPIQNDNHLLIVMRYFEWGRG